MKHKPYKTGYIGATTRTCHNILLDAVALINLYGFGLTCGIDLCVEWNMLLQLDVTNNTDYGDK